MTPSGDTNPQPRSFLDVHICLRSWHGQHGTLTLHTHKGFHLTADNLGFDLFSQSSIYTHSFCQSCASCLLLLFFFFLSQTQQQTATLQRSQTVGARAVRPKENSKYDILVSQIWILSRHWLAPSFPVNDCAHIQAGLKLYCTFWLCFPKPCVAGTHTVQIDLCQQKAKSDTFQTT